MFALSRHKKVEMACICQQCNGQLTAGAETVLNVLVLEYVKLDIQVLFIVSIIRDGYRRLTDSILTIPDGYRRLTDYFDLVCGIRNVYLIM